MGRDSPFILSPQPPSCTSVPTRVAGKTKSGRDFQAGPDREPAPGKSSRGTQPRFSGHLLPSRFLPSVGQWLFPPGPGKSPVYVWDNNNRAARGKGSSRRHLDGWRPCTAGRSGNSRNGATGNRKAAAAVSPEQPVSLSLDGAICTSARGVAGIHDEEWETAISAPCAGARVPAAAPMSLFCLCQQSPELAVSLSGPLSGSCGHQDKLCLVSSLEVCPN